MLPLRFDFIDLTERVNQKINQKHGVSRVEVEEAVWSPTFAPRWKPDDRGVLRVLGIGSTASGRKLLVSLYPTDHPGVWNLATAFQVP